MLGHFRGHSHSYDRATLYKIEPAIDQRFNDAPADVQKSQTTQSLKYQLKERVTDWRLHIKSNLAVVTAVVKCPRCLPLPPRHTLTIQC